MTKKSIKYLILTERELVFLLRSDDIIALEQLYHNYKIRLYRKIFSIIKTKEETEAILKEVFMKVWYTRKDIDPAEPFRAYLLKITEGLIYDFFRKAALNKKIENYFLTAATAAGRRPNAAIGSPCNRQQSSVC